MKKYIHSSYLENVLESKRLKRTVKWICAHMKASGLEFEAIAFRGMSGALVAPLVAVLLNKDLIVCRKDEINHHSAFVVEGRLCCGSYVILDDFMASGLTITTIYHLISNARIDNWRLRFEVDKRPVLRGIFLYNEMQKLGSKMNIDGQEFPIIGCHKSI
jgi:orotate phosphoribosyltransferase